MNKKNKIYRAFGIICLLAVLAIFVAPEMAEARRGGGFGRSFGGSRNFRAPQRTPQAQPRSSFRNRTSTPQRMTPSQKATSSFGGQRLNSSKAYTQKYGTPRRTSTQTLTRNGVSQNYVMHGYGGYGSGLMMGYMMGATSWMWMMPFHPAFYYSKPYYADNPNGTVSVYPPTFSWSKLFFTLIVIGLIVYIIKVIIRGSKSGNQTRSSFS